MRLRFGIMCRGTTFARWEAECLQQLMELADPVLLLVDDRPAPPRRPLWQRLLDIVRRPELWWTLYVRRVNRRSAVLQSVSLEQQLAGVSRLSIVTVDRGRFSRYFADEDIERVDKYDLDFVVRFAFDIVRGRILEVPRYGVWSFHHDDIDRYRGGPPCFWEIYRNDPVSGAVLQRLTDRLDGGIVLKRGWFATRPVYGINRDNVYRGSIGWPAEVCRDLSHGAAEYITEQPASSRAPIDYRPGPLQLAQFLVMCCVRRTGLFLRTLFLADQWNVGILSAPPAAFLQDVDFQGVRWCEESERHIFIADPFPVPGQHGEALVEQFDYRTGVGRVRRLLSDGTLASKDEIDCSGHLSYPYCIEHNGDVYCLPESAASGRLTLYRLSGDDWVVDCVLLEDAVYDATPVEHQGQWWMFGTLPGPDQDASLHLWQAPDLKGPWRPCEANPVKQDVRSSRPGGTPFVVDGKLYRPAQDCSRSYGSALVINHVTELSSRRFREQPVIRHEIPAGLRYAGGIHTLAGGERMTCIDAKRSVFVPAECLRQIRRRLTRLGSFVRRKQS